MLLKVMGDKWDEPLCEISEPLSLEDYAAFLLCSDGFWELVLEDESKMSPPGTSYPTMVRVINGEMEPVKEKDFDTIMKRYQALKALQKAGKENTVEKNILEDDVFLR